MGRLISNRWLRLSAAVLLLAASSLLGLAWYTNTWTSADLLSYQGMSHECHPVWRDLFWHRIGPGQDVEEIIASTKPQEVERYGEFVRLGYQRGMCFSGVFIMARKGRLIQAEAGSCCWRRTFFDETTSDDRKGFNDAYEAHWRPIREKQAAEE